MIEEIFAHFSALPYTVWVPAVGAVLFALGLAATVRMWLLARGSVHWPTVEGVMLDCVLDSRKSEGSKIYFARVKYSYEVDGRAYISKTKGFHLHAGNDEAFVLEHPPGKSVTVFYNPANPQEATLETGDAYTNALAVLCGLAAFGVCVVFSLSAYFEWQG